MATPLPPCCCDQPASGWLQAVSPWVTWALVIVGWLIVHWTTVKRARRQEDLGAIDAIETRVVALRTQVVSYFTSDPANEDASAIAGMIKLELKSVSSAIRALNRYDLASEIMRLRQAMTGDPFESADREQLSHDDAIVQDVWLAADELVVALRKEFADAHRKF